MKAISVATTILDVIAVVAVVTGAFLISLGLGLIASGLAVGLGSLALDRAAEVEQKQPE